MRALSWLVILVGLAMAVIAVIGRFHGPATVTVAGSCHTASSILLAANTVLLVGVFLAVTAMCGNKDNNCEKEEDNK